MANITDPLRIHNAEATTWWLSGRHLPKGEFLNIAGIEWPCFNGDELGVWVWVPSAIDDPGNEENLQELARNGYPVLASIIHLAGCAGIRFILFDLDQPTLPELFVHDHDR